MTLQEKITTALKEAMKAKDSLKLESLRAIKSALLLEQTSSSGAETLTEDKEVKLLQKLVSLIMKSALLFLETAPKSFTARRTFVNSSLDG